MFQNVGPRWVFGQNGIDITWNNHQKSTGQTANDRHYVILTKMTQYCYSPDYFYIWFKEKQIMNKVFIKQNAPVKFATIQYPRSAF